MDAKPKRQRGRTRPTRLFHQGLSCRTGQRKGSGTTAWSIAALLAPFALAADTARAQVQGGWAFEIEYMPGSGGVVSPQFPEATVRLLAWFDPPQVFSGGDGDVVASDGLWTDVRLLEVGFPIPGPPPLGTEPGTIQGGAVRGIIAGQIALCGFAGCPQPVELLALWEGTWRAELFEPRRVELITENTTRFAYIIPQSQQAFPIPAVPGWAQIRVVPAPGPAGALCAIGALAVRRRRPGPADGPP